MKKIIFLIFLMGVLFQGHAQKKEAAVNFKDIDFTAALNDAKKENKYVFCNFSASWCSPCKSMYENVYTDKEVGELMNKSFISIYIDGDLDKWKEFVKQNKVTGYPTMIVFNQDGKEIKRMSGGMGKLAFTNDISSLINPQETSEMIAKLYLEGNRTPNVVNKYTFNTLRNEKLDEGINIINDYFNSLSDEAKVKAENLFMYEYYVFSIETDPKAKYFLDNYEKFYAENDTAKINKMSYNFIRNMISPYISGHYVTNNKDNKEHFMSLKKAYIDKLKDDNEYKSVLNSYYKIGVARYMEDLKGNSNYAIYMKLVRKEAPNLTRSDNFLVLINLSFLATKGNNSAKRTATEYMAYFNETYKGEISNANKRILERIASSFAIVKRGDRINFRDIYYNDAIKLAKQQDKLIFIDCYTSWCGPCKMLDEQTFNVEPVKKYFDNNFINLKIDMEKGEGPDLLKKFKVNSYPTLLLVNSEGEVVHREVGFIDQAKFLKIFSDANEKYFKK